ncbi:MAG: nitroreductase [Achromobacter sp.]|uniref:nitroreductase n=1 Tax=Achromobacter sp. TaxID=134375 RepID=UPI0012BF5327|nr:nitroreductase [Achromobacter sp.]MPS79677.1 nitroreductase [Achromobacter sp.]
MDANTLNSTAQSELNPHASSVDAAIASRFSCRAFLKEKLVPRRLIEEILELSRRAPSGSNAQPWNVYVLQGSSRDRLADAVCAEHDRLALDATQGEVESYDYYPQKWISPFIERRRENGWGLYSLLEIERGDKQKMHVQLQRNYRFFDAPVGLIFTVDRSMGRGSLLDYGTFLQNIMLGARARGLHTCPQAAWNIFPSTVLRHIGAGPAEMLVCGMSLGYADEDAIVNTFHTPRESVGTFTTWLE